MWNSEAKTVQRQAEKLSRARGRNRGKSECQERRVRRKGASYLRYL